MEAPGNNQMPIQCRSGCGFFGTTATDGYCSKCYKDYLKRHQAPPSANPSTASSSSVSSGFSTESRMESPVIPQGSPASMQKEDDTKGHSEEVASAAAVACADIIDEDIANRAAEATSSADLDAVDASGASSDDGSDKKKKNRCGVCKKKVGLTVTENVGCSEKWFVMMEESKTLLWVGNIDVRLSEYKLLRVVERFGKLSKFDYLLHQRGPDAGKPRGYAFIAYERAEDAARALGQLNGFRFGDRCLSVHLANNERGGDVGDGEARGGDHVKRRPTTSSHSQNLSSGRISKSRPKSPNTTRKMQIAAIEAKLKSLDATSSPPVVNFRSGGLRRNVPQHRTGHPANNYQRR
ncbi:unnamed protein product [Notodromas monacha]|uniref:RNA-binding protein 18 n=1 Tax=Notodromas monacha TaxID=399045 RepID=A0A7R9BGU5_9CRUS|nr:unnamed protein product [Notodromas monacha]CAG0915210.1 unnamed protein product [Notodromas monacha]